MQLKATAQLQAKGLGPVQQDQRRSAYPSRTPDDTGGVHPTSLADVERRVVLATLEQCAGDKPAAANTLGSA